MKALLCALFAIVILAPIAIVQADSIEPIKMHLASADRIRIQGFSGSVIYRANPMLNDITVHVHEMEPKLRHVTADDDWQFSFHRNDDTVLIEVQGPSSKDRWNNVLGQPGLASPRYDLVVDGPNRPLEIDWRHGHVQVLNLAAELHVTNLNGETDVQGGNGNVTIVAESSAIHLQFLKGHIDVDTYNSPVQISHLQGELSLENFIGTSDLADVSGSVTVTSYRGPMHLTGIKGNLEFASGNAPLHIDKFQGVLRGQSIQGPVFAEIEGDANVRMHSQEGTVHLRLPASGAWLNLGTNDGQILGPTFLKSTRLPSEQLKTGRLHGSNGGSVYVRTTSGNIRVE